MSKRIVLSKRIDRKEESMDNSQFSTSSAVPEASVLSDSFIICDFEDQFPRFKTNVEHLQQEKIRLERLLANSILNVTRESIFENVNPMVISKIGEAGIALFGISGGFTATVKLDEVTKRHPHLSLVCSIIDYISISIDDSDLDFPKIQISAIYDVATFYSQDVRLKNVEPDYLRKLIADCLMIVKNEYKLIRKRVEGNVKIGI